MIFDSFTFLLFLSIVLFLYAVLAHRWQNRMLLVASYVFYGWWDYRFLSLILISTIVDYFCGIKIHNTTNVKQRKFFLTLSILCNLGILGSFKYYNFFVESIIMGMQNLGVSANLGSLHIILPVGISFYTFQTMSYTIDVYRNECEVEKDFLNFALFVSFFPQLVAGPIERARNLLPQVRNPRTVTKENIRTGICLILEGYFRKVVIADSIAMAVEQSFAGYDVLPWTRLLSGVYLFAFQIYADFSGYSCIARGISRLLGFELMRNFKQPYLSTSITEFWHRWHISLSTWLRDYLYIPLGGNKKGKTRTYVNLMTTMILGGLWHGASWTFVIWGGIHGLMLAIHKIMLRGKRVVINSFETNESSSPNILFQILKIFVVFNLVCLTWIFFRAQSLAEAGTYLWRILRLQGNGSIADFISPLLFIGLLLFIDLPQYITGNQTVVTKWKPVFIGVVYGIYLLGIMTYGGSIDVPFIYFQF